jgi:uncharacterized peroxidase-related enzyme
MFVDPVREADAEGTVLDLLQQYESVHGKRPVLWEALANHPPLLEAHAQFYRSTIETGDLDQELKELVGVAVSAANDCTFCTSSHRVNLVEMFGYDGVAVTSITQGDLSALQPRERSAVEFAQSVAEDPQGITERDIETLQQAGFTDENIVELLGAIAQFVAANVYADALGISPDAYE